MTGEINKMLFGWTVSSLYLDLNYNVAKVAEWMGKMEQRTASNAHHHVPSATILSIISHHKYCGQISCLFVVAIVLK